MSPKRSGPLAMHQHGQVGASGRRSGSRRRAGRRRRRRACDSPRSARHDRPCAASVRRHIAAGGDASPIASRSASHASPTRRAPPSPAAARAFAWSGERVSPALTAAMRASMKSCAVLRVGRPSDPRRLAPAPVWLGGGAAALGAGWRRRGRLLRERDRSSAKITERARAMAPTRARANGTFGRARKHWAHLRLQTLARGVAAQRACLQSSGGKDGGRPAGKLSFVHLGAGRLRAQIVGAGHGDDVVAGVDEMGLAGDAGRTGRKAGKAPPRPRPRW